MGWHVIGRGVIISIIFIFLFSNSICSQQVKRLSIETNAVTDIVSVAFPNNISEIIPFYEYQYPILISLNLPADSLKNINADNITVFIKLISSSNNNTIYFKDGTKKVNTSYMVLACDLTLTESEEKVCGDNSKLSQEILLYLNSNNANENISGQVVVYASLTPFEDFIPVYKETLALQKNLNEIISKLNTSDPEIQKRINETEKQLATFHVEQAKLNINELSLKTGDVQLSIGFLLNQFIDQIQSILNFIAPDVSYSIGIILAVVLSILAVLFKLRKNGKFAIIILSIFVIIISVFQLVSPLLLIFVDIAGFVLILSILFARKSEKRKSFRSSDNFEDKDYEDLLRKRR